MNSSTGSETGGVVMLAMTVVSTAVGIALVLPLIHSDNQPGLPTVAGTGQNAGLGEVAKDYSEFYPTDTSTSRRDQTVVRSQRVIHRAGQAQYHAQTPATRQPQHSAPNHGRMHQHQEFFPGRERPETVLATRPPAVETPAGPTAWDRQQVTLAEPQTARPVTSMAVAQEPLPFPESDPFSHLTVPAAPDPAPQAPVIRPRTNPAVAAAPPAVAQTPAAPPVATASGQSVPVFAPTQVPAGSVYAPVTVNLDTTAFSDQIRLLEKRIDDVVDRQATPPAPTVARQNKRPREPRMSAEQIEQLARRAAQQVQREAQQAAVQQTRQQERHQQHSQQLARIDSGVDALARTVQSLQQQTEANTAQMQKQMQDRSQSARAAAEVIEGYRQELAAERRRADVERDLRHEESLRIAQREAALLREARGFGKPTPPTLPQTIPQVPVPRGAIVQPRDSRADGIASQPPPLSISRQVPVNQNAKDTSQELFVDPRPAPGNELPPTPSRSAEATEEPMKSTSAGMNTRVLPSPTLPPKAAPAEPLDPFEPFPSAGAKPQSVKTTRPASTTSSSSTPPLQLPSPDAKPQASTAAPASFTKQLRDKAVGFSNTYRFSMAVDDSGKPQVVEHTGEVCPKCGKIHPVNQPHTGSRQVVQAGGQQPTARPSGSGVRQTAAQTSGSTPASTMQSPPVNRVQKPAAPPRRRNTKQAGRGMRKMGQTSGTARQDSTSESEHSFLQLRGDTLTSEPEEPGILHRMSSTLRAMGRSML